MAGRIVGVHGVDPVAAGRPIDHVVVHQGGGMEHLEGRPGVDDLRVRSVAAGAYVGPVAEGGAEPFPPERRWRRRLWSGAARSGSTAAHLAISSSRRVSSRRSTLGATDATATGSPGPGMTVTSLWPGRIGSIRLPAGGGCGCRPWCG